MRYYGNIHVIDSCNGLVCFKVLVRVSNDDHTAELKSYHNVRCFPICNPTTRTLKSILPSSEKNWMNHRLSYSFGYNSEHDDYKIVVSSFDWTENDRYMRIFSLKANLWSYPTPTPTPIIISSGRIWENLHSVIFRDNMLYYLVSAEIADDGRWSGVSEDYQISRFDVVSDKWRDDLSLPSHLKKDGVKLGELDGQLYLRVGSVSTDVWILEEHFSWKKIFHLPSDLLYHQIIACSKDGHNRLLLETFKGDGDCLNWYDQRDNTMIPFKVEEWPSYTSVMLYIPSLVAIPECSLNKLQEVGEDD